MMSAEGSALDIQVVDPSGATVTGFRWLVQQDTTRDVTPGLSDPEMLSINFHRSHAPPVASGHETTAGPVSVALDPGQRYFVSVLPDADYALGGAGVAVGDTSVSVLVHPHPLPTAQISVFVFEDNHAINNAPDLPAELPNANGNPPMDGFTVQVSDGGGRVHQDIFGNPLGTTYLRIPSTGEFFLDAEGNPVVQATGSGNILTDADGRALVKNLGPGKYGVQVVPPGGTGWQQTATIEGTPTVDAWVKANEPPFFSEFGAPGVHVFVGFVHPFDALASVANGGGEVTTITGRIVSNHLSRPPGFSFTPAQPMPDCWVALNDRTLAVAGRGLYAAPCNSDSTFEIPNVPTGHSYQLAIFDDPLDIVFGSLNVDVPAGQTTTDLSDVYVFDWFGSFENYVFFDSDSDGFPDPGEPGMPLQNVNNRFRDGTIRSATATDLAGSAGFGEIFPFFHWLVMEVDFARYKATGVTVEVDEGGPVQPNNVLDAWRGYGSEPVLNPQAQPENGGASFRTEQGPVLTQAYQSFLSATNRVYWGKGLYGPGENGGITGIVFYATTRAEDDPRYAVGDPWEPGVPRVQVNLYEDMDADAAIDDRNGNGIVDLADVDNHPFGNFPGAEDIDWNGDTVLDLGDAVRTTHTDSWDDSTPVGCPGAPATLPNGIVAEDCYDGLRPFNQVRPGVFDGGYAFGGPAGEAELAPGTYIVEAVPPPHYVLVKEEDKNVDFGDAWVPSPQQLPALCVGDSHFVPAELSLFPGIAAPFAGLPRPLCDRKQVSVRNGVTNNTAADFHVFTEVPIAGRAVGFILNDLANEFDRNNPAFMEKQAPKWVPVSLRDWTGREIQRVHSDEYGSYSMLVPSTFSVNLPLFQGLAPAVHTICMNDPGPVPDPDNSGQFRNDPYFDPQYSRFCYTFNFNPGSTTYLDTPVLPVAAFAGPAHATLDCEYAEGVPMIAEVNGPGGGPVARPGEIVSLVSAGVVQVRNPLYFPEINPGQPLHVSRDYGFGSEAGRVLLDGVELQVSSWSDGQIGIVMTPADAVSPVATGQLVVERAEGTQSEMSITMHVLPPAGGPAVHSVSPGESIQQAIDTAADGDIVLVLPGSYLENVILHKRVALQGTGALSTYISAVNLPTEKVAQWRQALQGYIDGGQAELLPNQAPPEAAGANLGVGGGFATEQAAAITVIPNQGEFDGGGARIDGFTLMNSDNGGGIYVNGFARDFVISNNRVQNNYGIFAGGIRVGVPVERLTVPIDQSSENQRIAIRHNQIVENAGFSGPGGISLFNGADDYEISENWICGNFSARDGAGIGHVGFSPGGAIHDNDILFNQARNNTLTGSGGGLFVSGTQIGLELSQGSGSVTIERNLLQGNSAGTGDGGGIRLERINGADVAAAPDDSTNWHQIDVVNNMIVNNVAGFAGAVSLIDAAKVRIVHNTIAHNDSTATALAAFDATLLFSTPKPAGVVSYPHADLAGVIGGGAGREFAGFSNPLLRNNIIWQNRSFYWDAAANGGSGGLLPDPSAAVYDDLGVIGEVGGAAASLDPVDCILTQAGAPGHDDGAHGGTNSGTPPAFANAYFNSQAGLLLGTEFAALTGPIPTAVAFDEGGNFVDISYGPLSHLIGDYHLLENSPIQAFAGLAADDFDGDVRLGFIDVGADEHLIGYVLGPGLVCGLGFELVFVLLPLLVLYAVRRRDRRVRRAAGRAMRMCVVPLLLLGADSLSGTARAEVFVQCPGDTDGDAIIDDFTDPALLAHPNARCMHLAAGDGYANMADATVTGGARGRQIYIFGFSDLTGVATPDAINVGTLAATWPAPSIVLEEGDEFYLSVSNVGMALRPDLDDAHTVHWHGFPNATAVFDGVPDNSLAIHMGGTLTYYYNVKEPGTYLYHCHVEATEHMEMGMIGNLYVHAAQDRAPAGTLFARSGAHVPGQTFYAYNDGDGATMYHVEYPLQLSTFDPEFHDADELVQPLNFAALRDPYPMINGRGYPETLDPAALANTATGALTQPLGSRMTATQGQRVLLRVSNVSVTQTFTLASPSIPMTVVGRGARILRGPDGTDLFYETNSISLGGGVAYDVILDTSGVTPGTYYIYTTNLQYLSNDREDRGGIMTEIEILP